MKKMKSVVLALFALTFCRWRPAVAASRRHRRARVIRCVWSRTISAPRSRSDEPTIRRLLCAEMESVAERESSQFRQRQRRDPGERVLQL